MSDVDAVVSTRTGPFKVEADFDGVEVKSTSTYVLQLCNDSADEQRVTVKYQSGALAVLDSNELPFRDCTIAKGGKVSLAIAWTPRRVHFLDESVEIALHGKRSIEVKCNGSAMPNFGSNSPDENSQPNLFSNSTGLCVDTISMRSGSESSGTACTSPSARMQRVQSRMRRSLSHIHEAFDDTQRSCSRTRSISREPSVERFNRRASISGVSECSTKSRRSLSNTLSGSMQSRLRTPQIQAPDIGRRNSMSSRRNSLSSQSTSSVGISSEQRAAARNRPQSARSVSSAAHTRGASASGRAPSILSTDTRRAPPARGPPSRNVSSSVERKPSQSRHTFLRKPEKSCSHLSADSLKRLSASLSPSKSMPQIGGAMRPRALRHPTGVRTPSTGAPSMPVRNSRASSLRSTLHQTPSATPRHKEQTESFAIYHTESWQRKQDHAFTQWLNMVLGEAYKDSTGAQEAAVNRQVLLRCRQQLGQLRENDESIVHALNQVEQQIKANRLCFKENSFLDDAALRKRAVRAIMSYHPLWLRLGIDTVLNRRTFQEGDQDHLGVVTSADLEAVVREELLSDATLLGGASLLRRGDRRELLSQLVIYRVLTLVILLDRIPSKMQLPQQAPFLFRLGSECKSSESILMEVLHSSLSGVGKLSKHLAKMHYEVHFTQRDVDEWPMSISSLGTDLSNGIILCKLVTLLLGQDVMAEVRRPTAAQRVIKVRNLRIALGAATAAGIDLSALSANRGEANEKVAVKVDNVLSGHCREVLALLWAVANKSFERTVPVDHLQTELRLLERKIKSKGLWSDTCQFSLQPGNDTPVARLLFEWVQAVCGLYGVTVRNCGSSFTDGSVLCLLIHHYVPSLVPWTSIQIPPPVPLDVAQQVLGSKSIGGLTSLSWADYVGMQNSVIQEEIEEHRSGIIHNFELIHKASRCLGDVPDMLSASDITTRFCDERAVLLFLSSMCPRLLAFASEGKAAHTIAKWWRWARVRLITLNRGELVFRVRAHLHKESVVARWHHLSDQVHHIPFLARLERARAQRDRARKAMSSLRVAVRCAILAVRLRHRAAEVRKLLEKERLHREAQLARMHSAAGVVQAHYRGYRVRQQVALQRGAAEKIAVAWRAHKLRVACRAATVIQSHVRSWRARQEVMQAIRAAVIIQSHARGMHARKRQRDRMSAAVRLQAAWRMYVIRHQYVYLRRQAVIIQAATRGMLCRSECAKRSHAASIIQGAVRLLRTRRRLAMRRNAATVIQARVRGATARNRFLSLRAAAVTIQAAARMRYAQRLHLANRSAAVVIQSAWRRRRACLEYARSIASIQRIQAHVRSFLVRLHLERQRRAVVVVQAAVRGRMCRQQFVNSKRSVTVIQTSVRGLIARREYAKDIRRVVLLQAASRQWKARRLFMRQRSAVIKMQAAARGMLARVALRQQHSAAKRLQAAWRAHCCRQEFQVHLCHVVRSQALVRGFLVRRRISKQNKAAVSIQRHWRGFQGRQQCACMKASVVFLQAQARGSIARRQFLRQRDAAVVIQAYARMWLVMQEMQGADLAALNIQTCWRMWICRQQFRQMKTAAGVIQRAWRAYAVRRRQEAAAVCIQSWWRMYHVLSDFQAERAAAVCVQKSWRGFSCRQQIAKWNTSAVIIQKNMARFHVQRCIARQRVAVWRIESAYAAIQSKRLAQLREQVAAAKCVQQAWRVHVVRKEVQRRCAALAVITRMLPKIRAACQKCRDERRLRTLATAAVPIQAAVRAWIQRRNIKRQTSAAVKIQAHFRGRLVRTASTQEVKHMARRLKRLEPMPDNHSHCLGPRVMAALSQLLCSNSIEQARSACEAAAWGTTYSRNACAWLVQDGALSALAHFMKSCSTNKSHSSILTAILTILVNILSHPEHVLHVEPKVLAALVPIVTDLLQLYRDTGGVFRLAVSVLKRACSRSGVLGHIPVERTLVKWKGVYRVLYTRLQKEGQYLSKLEHKKGSDASACNATRSLIQTSEQLKILKQLIKPLHKRVLKQVHESSSSRLAVVQHADAIAELPQPGPGDWIHEITKGGSMWVPKNTKVRATFREVLHNVHGFELPEASEEDDGGETGGDVLTDTANSRPIHASGQTAPPTGSKKTGAAAFHENKCSENVDPEQGTV